MSDIKPQGNQVSAHSLQISDNSWQICPALIILLEDDKFYANELLKVINDLIPDFPLKKHPSFKSKIHFIFVLEKIIKILKQSNTQNILSIMDQIRKAFYNRYSDLMAQKQAILSLSLKELKSRQTHKRNKILKIQGFLYIFQKYISEGHIVAINLLYPTARILNSVYKEFTEALNQQEKLNYQPDDIQKYTYEHSIIDINQNICFWEDINNFIFYFQFIKSAEYKTSRTFKNKLSKKQGFPKKQKPINKQNIVLKQKPRDMHITKRLPQNSEEQQNIHKRSLKKSHQKTNEYGFKAFKQLYAQEQDQNHNQSNRTKRQKFKIQPEPEYQKSSSRPDKNQKMVEQMDENENGIVQEIDDDQSSSDNDDIVIKKNSLKTDQSLMPDYQLFNRKLYSWCKNYDIQLPTIGFMRYAINRVAIVATFLQIQQSKGMMWFADHQKDYHQFLKNLKNMLKQRLKNPKLVEPGSDSQIAIILLKKQIPNFKKSYSRFQKGDLEGAVKILFNINHSQTYFEQALKRIKFIEANIPIRRRLLSIADRLENALPKKFIKKEFGVQILNEKQYKIQEVKKENGNLMMLDEENKQFWQVVAQEIYKQFGAVIQFIEI